MNLTENTEQAIQRYSKNVKNNLKKRLIANVEQLYQEAVWVGIYKLQHKTSTNLNNKIENVSPEAKNTSEMQIEDEPAKWQSNK